MAISVVQHASGNSGGSSTGVESVAFGSNNTLGNAIYLAVSSSNGAGGTNFTIADTKLNSYSIIDTQYQSNAQLQTFLCTSCAAGANTVTATLAGTGTVITGLAILEISGLAASPIDVLADGGGGSGGVGGGTSNVQPGPVTNTVANEIFVTAYFSFSGAAASTINSSYTVLETGGSSSGANNGYISIASLIVSSTAATNPIWTPGSGAFSIYSQIVGLKAASVSAVKHFLPLLGVGR